MRAFKHSSQLTLYYHIFTVQNIDRKYFSQALTMTVFVTPGLDAAFCPTHLMKTTQHGTEICREIHVA